ncbi:MAG: CHAP domain-containing protein [Candidatus Dormibacteria bacterium]
MTASLTALVPASADTTGALVAQRQLLQQQVGGLGGDKAKALSDLLAAQDALNNIQASLRANSVYLGQLNEQQDRIRGKISNTEHDLAQERQLIAETTRGQYKHHTGDQAVEMIFSSQNFGQMLGRIMAEITVQRRMGDAARKIKVEQAELKSMGADLDRKQVQAAILQDQLTQENGKELVLVADYDQRVAHLDGESKDLLGQIGDINGQIAAQQAAARQAAARAAVASRPSGSSTSSGSSGSPGFGSGGGPVNGGSSCGNHFSYGYCTWYVANRRCIPWFGNAWEWYGNAQAYGYPVGSQARVGAVAVWDQRMSGYGHVGYVESVSSSGFTVSEMNYTAWGQVDSRFVPYSNPGPLTGFIYAK